MLLKIPAIKSVMAEKMEKKKKKNTNEFRNKNKNLKNR